MRIYCSECGHPLKQVRCEGGFEEIVIHVTPCKKCIDAAVKDERDIVHMHTGA